MCQAVSSTIASSLSTLISQKTPDYQSIQNCITSNIQSSNALNRLSSGILSANDVIQAVVQGLSSYGIQNEFAQSAATQYIASLGAGTTLQSYANAVSSAVTQAVQQSNAVTAGQESSFCQTVSSSISSSLSSMISQKTPSYQIIQDSITSNLQSTTTLNRLSSGILSTNDVISTVVQGLTSNGIQTSVAQSAASQYLSSLPIGTTLQSYANAISSAITQAIQQSNVITSGQESVWSQTISSTISNSLSSLISQKTPNYQTIQSCVNSNLQSSDALRRLSSGILSSNDIISTVVQGLTSSGFQSTVAQSAASKYLSTIGVGATMQSYASAISSAVTQAVQQSNIVTSGQESTFCQTVTSTVSNSLSSLMSQKTPNYQIIQSNVNSNIQSSTILNRLSSGILSADDIINAVVQGLTSNGIQTAVAQSTSTQYLSSLPVGTTLQTYASAISSAVTQAVKQSNVVTAGQESTWSRDVSSAISNSLSSLISQKTPNYQTIQNCVNSNVQSASLLRPLSTGILSSNEIINGVVQGLTSNGVQSGIAQNVAIQYLSSLASGTSLESYSNAISSVVKEAVQQSNSVIAGQEGSACQTISSAITNSLSSMISRKPAPMPQPVIIPLPAPTPVVQQQASSSTSISKAASTQVSSKKSTTTSTEIVIPVVSVDYPAIQNYVSFVLQSSSSFNRLSTGIVSSNDVIRTVVEALTSYGVSSETAQSTATQYLSTLDVNSPSQDYASAISSAVTQALQQSKLVRAGQEASTSQIITSYITSKFSSLISQKSRPAPAPILPSKPMPAPRPLPAPTPIVQQQVSSVSSTQTSTSSASAASAQSSTATSTQVVAPSVPLNYQVIESTVNSNIQSSTTLNRLSTGILPANDVINAVVQGLTSYGVQSGTAQNTATQYLSPLPVGSTLQTYANAISSAVTQSAKQSNVITAGQESSWAQAVSSVISNSLSSLISQKMPNYQSIQSCVKTNLLSSSTLNSLSTGILSANDIIGTVVQGLTSYGVQSGIAQNMATQYLSTLAVGTPLESYSNAISFAVTKALEQSNTASTGQEGNICQSISSSITTSLSSLISQRSQPRPAPTPIVQQQISSASSSQASSSSQVSSQMSTTTSTETVVPVVSVDYQAIQNYVSYVLQSSSTFNRLATGIISSNDVIRTVVQALSSIGVSSETAQSTATQYLSTLGMGSSSQDYANAISSTVSQALQQSKLVSAGQEASTSQIISSYITNSLSSLISQKSRPAPVPVLPSIPRPAPSPLPAPMPVVQQQVSSVSSTQTSASSSSAVSSQSSTATSTQIVAPVVSVNYQAIQSCINQNIQSSNSLNSLSSGILTANDIINSVVQGLASNGVQSDIARNVAGKYLAALGAGTSLQSYASAISSVVNEAVQQTNVVTAGQETSMCQAVSSSITNSISSLISYRSRPAPAPAPVMVAPVPLPSPVPSSLVSQVVKQETSQSSASSAMSSQSSSTSMSMQTTGQMPVPAISMPVPAVSMPSVSSSTASAYSAQTSRLMSESAAQRISTLSNSLRSVLSTGDVNYLSLSNAIANAVSQISTTNSSLTQTEVFIEALLEIVVALLQYISPNAIDANLAATQFAESLVRVMC